MGDLLFSLCTVPFKSCVSTLCYLVYLCTVIVLIVLKLDLSAIFLAPNQCFVPEVLHNDKLKAKENLSCLTLH